MSSSSMPALLAGFILATCAQADGAAPPAIGALPLGARTLVQTSTDSAVAPGVMHYRVRRGRADRRDSWILMSPVAGSVVETDKFTACFAKLGLTPAIGQYQIPGQGARSYSVLRGGRFASRGQAQQRARRSACTLHVRHSSEDADNASGPWLVDVIAIDPARNQASLLAATGSAPRQLRTRTLVLARAAHALVAINGGFFVEHDEDGYAGQPAGLSILGGRLNSAPVNLRPAVLLSGALEHPLGIVRRLEWHAYLQWSDGARTVVDGINRKPGLVRNCGREAGDRPIHDHTCSYPDDVVYFPPGSIFTETVAPAVRYALAASGTLRKLDAGQFAAAAEGTLALLPASARLADIEQHVKDHATARFHAESSVPAMLDAKASAVNAGPTLLADGSYVREDAQEGWAMEALPDDATHQLLMHEWINRRNPRTAVGVRDDGTVLLVTVDGHQHARSVGLTIEELRQLMQALGARDAVNLDGGGSTALVIRDQLVNKPSDPGGERAVGDAIVLGKGAQP